MKRPIKLLIQKMGSTKGDWVRYYKADKILLEQNSILKHEAQFAYYLYNRFGTGRYYVRAWQKGYEGFWVFWLGNIYENGYMRDVRKNKEMDKLKRDHVKASSYEEKEMIEDEMQFEREMQEMTKGSTRHGPMMIKKTRPGLMHEFMRY